MITLRGIIKEVELPDSKPVLVASFEGHGEFTQGFGGDDLRHMIKDWFVTLGIENVTCRVFVPDKTWVAYTEDTKGFCKALLTTL